MMYRIKVFPVSWAAVVPQDALEIYGFSVFGVQNKYGFMNYYITFPQGKKKIRYKSKIMRASYADCYITDLPDVWEEMQLREMNRQSFSIADDYNLYVLYEDSITIYPLDCVLEQRLQGAERG